MSAAIPLSQLTTAENLELMHRLWVDLSRHSEDVPSQAWHGAVLDGCWIAKDEDPHPS